jgi:hypothetical protein
MGKDSSARSLQQHEVMKQRVFFSTLLRNLWPQCCIISQNLYRSTPGDLIFSLYAMGPRAGKGSQLRDGENMSRYGCFPSTICNFFTWPACNLDIIVCHSVFKTYLTRLF